MKMKRISLFCMTLSLAACAPSDDLADKTGPPQNVPSVTPVDSGPSNGTESVTTEFCAVKIVWNFTDKIVTFSNEADQTAWITVNLVAEGTQLIDKIVYSQSEGTAEVKGLSIGIEVEVIVEFLDPNLSLDQWKKCDEKRYVLGE